MQQNYFDPGQTELLKGVNLIEASAGTGKTYAIAMLVLRFVVEQAMPIDEILVVTFTKAATEELKDRVRGRLAEAKRALPDIQKKHPAISKIGLAGGVIADLSASDIHAATLPQRQAARKHHTNYYGTTLAIYGGLRN